MRVPNCVRAPASTPEALDINPRRVKDAALRKAIFVGTNREALANIQFQGLPYEEAIPGS